MRPLRLIPPSCVHFMLPDLSKSVFNLMYEMWRLLWYLCICVSLVTSEIDQLFMCIGYFYLSY